MYISKKQKFILVAIILIIVIIFAVKIINKNKENKQNNEKVQTTSSGINPNNASYSDAKIYEENGDIIIEQADGSKTIETTKTKENTGLVATTEETREKYEITNVKVELIGTNTVITGDIKNNDSRNHNVVINIKFYSDDNKIKGAASTKIQVDKQQTKKFTLSTMEDMTKYKYKIIVDYTD